MRGFIRRHQLCFTDQFVDFLLQCEKRVLFKGQDSVILGLVKYKDCAWTKSIFAGENKRPKLEVAAGLRQLRYCPTLDKM